ncbi:putative chemotaxis response regulator receiver (CheY-like) [Desulforapulum autotrophicum HRM2]|uniref:Chemotaxis response regulator receiver (CheY-like) n=1 Tax=Desulforapulum autotrophicum (strain ATCC 43914 / DSM 3382 / VKM B-1955 / HRM2) TaxID=177437 RepID=C0Q914_DESAH|nr:response regulator [Desulforapulum autotrophicum]ACN16519.1 putative chemotaxis response regulator receiver (CheY-like) [Desulforapulum autotrophicum HRM2]
MSYSILIVDDSLPMRSVIKRTLRAAGYGTSELLEAANGQEALELMKNSWVDIVMTDYNMPVMDGLEFIKTIKSNELSKDIPVVVISTEGNASKIKEFMDCGAAGYITKPFTAEVIRDLIVDILGEVSYEEAFDDSDENFDF